MLRLFMAFIDPNVCTIEEYTPINVGNHPSDTLIYFNPSIGVYLNSELETLQKLFPENGKSLPPLVNIAVFTLSIGCTAEGEEYYSSAIAIQTNMDMCEKRIQKLKEDLALEQAVQHDLIGNRNIHKETVTRFVSSLGFNFLQ